MTELYRIEARECQIWMHLFVSAGSLDRYADPVAEGTIYIDLHRTDRTEPLQENHLVG